MKSIKIKLIVGTALICTTISLTLAVLFYHTISKLVESDYQAIIGNAATSGHETVSALSARVRAYADLYSRNGALVDAVANQDMAGLEAVLVREYRSLRQLDPTIRTLEVTDVNGTVIMRGDDPSKKGEDRSQAPTVRKALTGESAHSLIVSTTGDEMAQDAVVPLTREGAVIGTLRVSSNMGEDTASYIKKTTGTEVVFLVDGKVNATTFKEAKDWMLPSDIGDKLKTGAAVRDVVEIAGQSYNASYSPLRSDDGQARAAIVTLLSRAPLEKERILALMKTAAAVAILTAILLPLIILGAFRLTRPINEMRDAMLALANGEGDLTARIRVSARDEIGEIAAAFNTMMEKFRTLIVQVAHSAEQVSSASEQLAAATSQVAEVSRLQSEAAAATASSVQQVTVSIGQVAEHAKEAENISRGASALSDQGNHIAQQAAEKIGAIAKSVNEAAQLVVSLNERSSEIRVIVDVIKDIADQTNLLALNAAIEAARAGEQGRGFSVVADEVRKLAERTTNATKEIAAMIDGIGTEIAGTVTVMQQSSQQEEQEVAIAKQIGEILGKISSEAARSAREVGNIAAASREQSVAAGDIAEHVEKIAQMTEENSASVAETSVAADHLSGLAAKLQTLVSQFKV